MNQHRYEITDFEGLVIESLLPNKPRAVPRADDRKVLNGFYSRLRTGSPWADIPERYGPPTPCYNRFVRWRKPSVWGRIFEPITQRKSVVQGNVEYVPVDNGVRRANKKK